MSNSVRKKCNSSEPQRLVFEHIDRRGRVSQLPLSSETQRLFSAAKLGSRSTPHADPASERPVRGDARAAARSLTMRQWQVFDLLIGGLSSKQIGHELSISPRTVEIHRAQLMQKMGVRNTASLVRVALFVA
jgi:DNA-binding NarL/FixJ family response regulator